MTTLKKSFAGLVLLLGCAQVQAQNIEGQIIASQYGHWKVPGFSADTLARLLRAPCRVQGGASFFFAFTVGTPVMIVDADPAFNRDGYAHRYRR